MGSRHIPQRTCIGCREESGKRALIRIVRSPRGSVAVDVTGRAAGRGAYLHTDPACWEKALKGGSIGYALRTSPSREDADALRAYAATLHPPEPAATESPSANAPKEAVTG